MLGLKKSETKTIVITGLGLAIGSVLFIPALQWAKSKFAGGLSNVTG